MVTKPKTKEIEEKVEDAEVLLKPGGYLASKSELLQAEQIEDIKHVFRVVSPSGEFLQGENVHPASVIEDYLKQSYFGQGYTLYSVNHLRTNFGKTGEVVGEQMLYILVKYAQ